MVNEELIKFIRQETASGVSKDEIRKSLLNSGWPENDINAGFLEVERPTPPPYVSPRITQSSSVIGKEGNMPSASFSSEGGKFSITRFFRARLAIIIAICALALVFSGGIYAYVMKIGPFARPPYTEKNLLSGILRSLARIDTSSYSFSASFSIAEREDGAEPFSSRLSNESELRAQYQNDAKRAQSVSQILQTLQEYRGKYPATLGEITVRYSATPYRYYGNRMSTEDPRTKEQYRYSVTENGKNFILVVTFETRDAISQIRRSYQYFQAGTSIDGKQATFTKDSYPYIYVRSEPPKPYLVQLNEYFGVAPQEGSMEVSASAQTDWGKAESADWKFHGSANGDFGDLTYKVDIEALKKDGIYYFRINNMPSFFFSLFGGVKGEWIEIDPNDDSVTTEGYYNELSYLTSQLPEAEKEYKKRREELTQVMRIAAQVADEENLISLEYDPYSERVDDRTLYRYDLKFRKSAIVPFYEHFISEIDELELVRDYRILADEGYLEYLKSPEFDEIFDYYDKNTSFSLWVDPQGFPAMVTYTIRVVPPGSVQQLKEKQINILFKTVVSDINEPVDIKKPDNTKTIDKIIGESALSQPVIRSRDARRISDIKQLQLALELYFDAVGNYPSNLEKLAPTYIPVIPTDPLDKTLYRYTYHTSRSRNDGYHLGASLQDASSQSLLMDADCDSTTGKDCGYGVGVWNAAGAFYGDDAKGCRGETDRYCYDVTP